MKRQLILVGVLLLALAMAMSPTGSAYSSSQRGCITFAATSYLRSQANYTTGANVSTNETLPFAIGVYDRTLTKISFHAVGAVKMISGRWNNRVWPANQTYAAGHWWNESIWIAESNAPGFVNKLYSHLILNCNNTNWDAWQINVINGSYINNLITVTEEDVTDPDVGGRWRVNDTINFTADLPYAFRAYLKMHYTSSAAGVLDYYPLVNGTTINDDYEFNVVYSKDGPAKELDEDNIEEAISGASHTVTLTFDSVDTLKDADWGIDVDDTMWDGVLDNIDEASFAVKINDKTLDSSNWELGSIDMENVDIDNDENTVIFTWTTPGGGTGTGTPPPTTAAPNALTEEAVAGVPNWALGAIVIIICIAGYAIWKNEKKK